MMSGKDLHSCLQPYLSHHELKHPVMLRFGASFWGKQILELPALPEKMRLDFPWRPSSFFVVLACIYGIETSKEVEIDDL